MSISPLPYHIQSVNTKFFVVSAEDDMVGEEVETKPGKETIPDDSVLFTNVPIWHGITVVEIFRVAPTRLYVSLKEDAVKTKLTWSDKRYLWVINNIGGGRYVISPANGADLFWLDEFGVGDHIEVRRGRDIRRPQNEWVITPAQLPLTTDLRF